MPCCNLFYVSLLTADRRTSLDSSDKERLGTLSIGTEPLLTTPTLNELDAHVIPHIALDWELVGINLKIENSTLRMIETVTPHGVDREGCCRQMFTRWLSSGEGTGSSPRVWKSVLLALKNAGYTSVVGHVEKMLNIV